MTLEKCCICYLRESILWSRRDQSDNTSIAGIEFGQL